MPTTPACPWQRGRWSPNAAPMERAVCVLTRTAPFPVGPLCEDDRHVLDDNYFGDGVHPRSVWRCCVGRWRSWRGSAMRSTAGWCRSPPRSRVTGSGVRRVPGRCRRWWRGSWASLRTTPRRSSPWGAGFEEFPRCAAMMRDGQLSVGSGRGGRRAGRGGLRRALRPAGLGRHGHPAACGDHTRTATRVRHQARTGANTPSVRDCDQPCR